jgi:hypothetical protein
MKHIISLLLLLFPLFGADVTVVVTNHATDTRQVQIRNSDRHVVGTITVSGSGSDARTWSAEALEGGVVQLWVGDYLEGQVKLPSLEGRSQVIITIARDNSLTAE